MVKDIKWLREELYSQFESATLISGYSKGKNWGLRIALELIDQLDEPKKVVIPQYVADWIESQDDPIYEMCINYEMWGVNGDDGTTRFTREIAEWFDDNLNVENYYRACIDGYEVEKEKKYYVLNNCGRTILVKLFGKQIAPSQGMKLEDLGNNNSDYQFTEQEIKNYDKRYWQFAEEVTE